MQVELPPSLNDLYVSYDIGFPSVIWLRGSSCIGLTCRYNDCKSPPSNCWRMKEVLDSKVLDVDDSECSGIMRFPERNTKDIESGS